MPRSSRENKAVVKGWYDRLEPEVVLDIGVGQGTYALLCRGGHAARWIGVEAWAPYVADYGLAGLYEEIIIGDVRYLDLKRIQKPDMVIIGDVLEHMKKDEAKQLINDLLEITEHLVISVPLKHLAQDAWHGNWFETHVDHWHHDDMLEFLSDRLVETKTGKVLGYYLCSAS